MCHNEIHWGLCGGFNHVAHREVLMRSSRPAVNIYDKKEALFFSQFQQHRRCDFFYKAWSVIRMLLHDLLGHVQDPDDHLLYTSCIIRYVYR